jgi:hypothetical protein
MWCHLCVINWEQQQQQRWQVACIWRRLQGQSRFYAFAIFLNPQRCSIRRISCYGEVWRNSVIAVIFRILKSKERYVIPPSSVAALTRAGTASLLRIATVHFPCGLGRVATLLLNKLEGLDHGVTYVWGPWKAHDRLRLADTLIHTKFRFISLNLFVKLHCHLQNWSMVFV